jgi:hypothetical protein
MGKNHDEGVRLSHGRKYVLESEGVEARCFRTQITQGNADFVTYIIGQPQQMNLIARSFTDVTTYIFPIISNKLPTSKA